MTAVRRRASMPTVWSLILLSWSVSSVQAANLAHYLIARAGGDDEEIGKHGLTSADQNSTSSSTTFIPPPDSDQGTVAKVKAKASDFWNTKYGVLEGKWIVLIVAILVGLFILMVTTACILRNNRKNKLAKEMEQIEELERASGQQNKQDDLMLDSREPYGVV